MGVKVNDYESVVNGHLNSVDSKNEDSLNSVQDT